MRPADPYERAVAVLIAGFALFCLGCGVLALATGNLVGIIPLMGAVLFGAVYREVFT